MLLSLLSFWPCRIFRWKISWGFLDATLTLSTNFYSISNKGFQVWLGNHKLSSRPPSAFLTTSMTRPSLSGSYHHTSTSQHDAMHGKSTGMLALWPVIISHSADTYESPNIPTSVSTHCGMPPNAHHVWLCCESAVFFIWALTMSSFSTWLEAVHSTATDIIYWIIQCLTKWRSSEPFSPANTDLPDLLHTIEVQFRMDWLVFFKGWIAVEGAGILQQAHFLWPRLRNTLIVKLWEILSLTIWDHQKQIKCQPQPQHGPNCLMQCHPTCHPLWVFLQQIQSPSPGLAFNQPPSPAYLCQLFALPWCLTSLH
jgi:hypothetical protein